MAFECSSFDVAKCFLRLEKVVHVKVQKLWMRVISKVIDLGSASSLNWEVVTMDAAKATAGNWCTPYPAIPLIILGIVPNGQNPWPGWHPSGHGHVACPTAEAQNSRSSTDGGRNPRRRWWGSFSSFCLCLQPQNDDFLVDVMIVKIGPTMAFYSKHTSDIQKWCSVLCLLRQTLLDTFHRYPSWQKNCCQINIQRTLALVWVLSQLSSIHMVHKGYNSRLESLTRGRAVGTWNMTLLHRQVVQHGFVCAEIHASWKGITRRKQRCSDVARQFNSVGQISHSCSFCVKKVEYWLPIFARSFARLFFTWIKFETLS